MDATNLTELSYDKAGNYFRSVIFDQTQLDLANTRFQVVKVPPGKTVRKHHHRKRTEVFLILQGAGQIYVGGSLVASKQHDIALCRPGNVHEVINTSDDNLLIGVFATHYSQDDSHWEENA